MIHHQVAVDARQDRGGHLVEREQATDDDLAAALEGEEGQWDQFLEVDVVSAADDGADGGDHDVGLDEGGGDDDAEGLEEEGGEEGPAGLGAGGAGEGEDDAA